MKKPMLTHDCPCGTVVRGVNPDQLKHNITEHENSKKHKAILKLRAGGKA